MESPPHQSVTMQIFQLQTQHRRLSNQIDELYEFAAIDQVKIQRLKREKLKLKDTIERLKNSLIPDLDA